MNKKLSFKLTVGIMWFLMASGIVFWVLLLAGVLTTNKIESVEPVPEITVYAEEPQTVEWMKEEPTQEVKEEVKTEEKIFLGCYKITGYDTCVRCCGKTDGITASGTRAMVGRTVAAPKNLPFGTVLYIEGLGYRTVEDRGGSIQGQRLDVLCANHSECYKITGWRNVWIVK